MKKIISFPHLGPYYIPIAYMIKCMTKCDIIIPKHNKETILLGSKYSPSDICMPFKYNLGNYISALSEGANILIQAGGGCRYGYYAELQEQILKSLNYKFKFINLIKDNHISIIKLYKEMKLINNKLTIFSFLYYFIQGMLIIIFTDKIRKYIRENKAKSTDKKMFDTIYKQLEKSYTKDKLTISKIIKIYLSSKQKLTKIKLNNDDKIIKILIVGELYTIIDSNANNDLENKLLSNNIILYRYTDLTYLLITKLFTNKNMLNQSKKYIKYHLGADATKTIYHSIKHCKQSIDGIIHIKSFGCVPEINAMPILNQINNEYKIPILYLSYDAENNISNIDTKLEAFYDMIKSKKQ